MTILTPKEIVSELDRYIVGQKDAKKSVAVALRNRWRRKQVDASLRDEIVPKNILMIGPTGVGKTEIARRLAKLAGAPFIKVEATKFTEVGYVGRDVDSIIRDLTEIAVKMIRDQSRKEVLTKAELNAEERVLDALVGATSSMETREKYRNMLRNGELADREIEIQVQDSGNASSMPMIDIPGLPGGQMGFLNVGDMIGKVLGGGERMKTKKMKVSEAYNILNEEESDKLIDEDKMIRLALEIVENEGIVFIDEIDKIVARGDNRADVSREGVQRDLLPLIEGTVVATKYGQVKTDHVLFITSGAFHLAKPSDLLPELQGRLPIRVELSPLGEAELVRILTEPENSLLKQYKAMMQTEKMDLEFTTDGIEKIAEIAASINRDVENIGARRLHTIMERLLEEISFNASDGAEKHLLIDAKYVEKQLGSITTKADLSKFIL